jgi:DNA-binding beta-propeller fold protein YncE
MDELERQLRDALSGAGSRAGYPQSLKTERARRIRFRQALYVLLTTCLVTAGFVGIAFGLGLPSDSRRGAPAGPLPLPQRLYILDGAPRGLASEGEAVAVQENVNGVLSVERRYRLGAHPDIAISPDGSRLYGVAFVFLPDDKTASRLRVFDTDTGQLIEEVDVPDYPGSTGFHTTQKIAVSRDGGRVYVVSGFPTEPDRSVSLATFDVSSGSMLSNVAPLEGCNDWPTILPRSGREIIVVCPGASDVRFLQISDSGDIQAEQRLPLPTTKEGNVQDGSSLSAAVLSPDTSKLYAVTIDGVAFLIDVALQTVTETLELPLPAGVRIGLSQVRISPDGGALFLGLHAGVDALHARDIIVVDTSSWKAVSTLETPLFSAFDVASDGSRIFTIDYDATSLEQVFVQTGLDLTALGNVASLPQAIYVGPQA